jgi:sulfhydrogenase subunit beta (sulfur reductase)
MMERKIISKEALPELFGFLTSAGKKIFAPVRKEGFINFSFVSRFEDIEMDYIQTKMSAKSAAFPKIEKLLNYKITKEGQSFEEYDVNLFPEVVIWGAHPCDAAAFNPLNAVFTWETQDKYFTRRLEKLLVIGLSCVAHDDYCFCTSVNVHPGDTAGSDILLTPLPDGNYLAEIVTGKGKSIADGLPGIFTDAPPVEKEKLITLIEKRFSLDDLHTKINGMFDHPVWKGQALRCIGCGACTYVCPICSCFDMQDEGGIFGGKRYRCWDSCGFGHFTIHTSGHNPRETQDTRWRQRLMHKFSYQPQRQQVFGCVGCGRCSRSCPVDMNISEHLTQIMEIQS